jgi:transcription factor TFIIIB component B''
MLKTKNKIFAPKAPKGGFRRPPGAASAPSSARPSVERQSQTPAPRQESVAPVSEQESGPQRSEESRESVEVQSQPEASQRESSTAVTQDTARHPSPDTRKRKTRDEDILGPPAKRIPTTIERLESSPAQTSVPTTQEPTSRDVSGEAATQDIPIEQQRVNQNKRKAREEDNIEPPAKRVSTNVNFLEESTTQLENAQQTHAELAPRNASPVRYDPFASSEIGQSSELEAATEDTRADDNLDAESQPSHEPTPEAPRYRYPSPENIARIVDDIPGARPGSMGPAGGGISSGLGPAGDMGAAGANAQAIQVSEIVPMAALNPDGTSGGIIEEVPSGTEKGKGKKKKATKRKKIQAAQAGDDVRATVEMQLNRPRRVKGGRRVRRKRDGAKERKQRATTPEGAEDEEIDRETMTMTDLCKDLKIGKPFSMHGEIKQRIIKKKVELARAKLRKDHPELIPLIDAEDNVVPGEAGPSGTNVEPEAPEAPAPASGPQMRIIDGQIVIDDRTLQIDRQKRAQAEQQAMEEVEENDFTRVITSGTWMKMERAQPWDMAANELFYTGLRQYGTDFQMIAGLFPHRNRRQIKLKFNKEEKVNPAKVNRALTGVKEPIDLDEFQKMSDIQLEEVADIEAEREQFDQEQMTEQAKHEAAKAEVTRKKKEAIQNTSAAARRILATVASDDDEPSGGVTGGESAKENREPAASARGRSTEATAAPKGRKKGAAPKKQRKNKHSHYAGGDEVEVLGTID